MTNQLLADQLKAALDMWIELTGVDPGATRWASNFGGGMCDYSIGQMHRALKEALDLDTTNITAHLMLDAFSTQYFRERKFSVDELLEDPSRVAAYVAKATDFRVLAQSPEIMDISESFALSMRQALRHYGADTEDANKIIADRHELAFLRRDALRSIERLRVDQFLKGSAEAADVRPTYNGIVHQFWNINSLINTACRQPSGVTLNLIRDPKDFQSYFAFAIRNGGNLFVLSDVPVHSHPLKKYMSRRPDREFGERSSRNWFPYDLLNIKFDEESDRLYIDKTSRMSLIPLQQEADQLKPLAALAPQEIIWIVMMFDLIVDRFWAKGYQAPQISYTGQMIREETPLIDSAERANLPVAGYQPLSLPALSVADVAHDKISPSAIGKKGGSPNKWMEDRYATRVSDEVLNLMGTDGMTRYLPPVKTRHDETKHADTAIVSANQVVTVPDKDDSRLPFWDKEGRYSLHAMNPASFGTQQELEDDRGFLARHNLAKGIQRLADDEYEKRKDKIAAWWEKSIQDNLSIFYGIATLPEVWLPLDTERFPGAAIGGRGWHTTGGYTFAKRYTHEEANTNFYMGLSCTLLRGGTERKRGEFCCHVTGAASTYKVVFQPQTAADLALLAGCRIEDLPDILQHWCLKTHHEGNHILDRIDPMAWALKNPWQKMNFAVTLFLSIRGLKALEKQYAPPPDLLERSAAIIGAASPEFPSPFKSGETEQGATQ